MAQPHCDAGVGVTVVCVVQPGAQRDRNLLDAGGRGVIEEQHLEDLLNDLQTMSVPQSTGATDWGPPTSSTGSIAAPMEPELISNLAREA